MSELVMKFKAGNGTVELYPDRLEFKRGGFMNVIKGLNGDLVAKDATLLLSKITTIQFHKPSITAPTGTMYFAAGGQHDSLIFGLEFSSFKLKEAMAFKDKVQSLMASQSAPAANTGSASVADEIKKFKELLEAGAITQEEFDRKKSQLL